MTIKICPLCALPHGNDFDKHCCNTHPLRSSPESIIKSRGCLEQGKSVFDTERSKRLELQQAVLKFLDNPIGINREAMRVVVEKYCD